MTFAYCLVSLSPLRAEASDASEMVSQLFFGEPIRIIDKKNTWAHIETILDGYQGFMDHKHIRSLSEKELKRWLDGNTLLSSLLCEIQTPWGAQKLTRGAFVPYDQVGTFTIGKDIFSFASIPNKHSWSSPVEAASSYLNAPYLWGGKSPFGIDCSGLTQTVFRFFEINLPRDASQQADCGREISFGDREPGDLAFFKTTSEKITHVGLCGSNDDFIHASGRVRIDSLSEAGILNSETGELTHYLHSIMRI